MYKISIFQIIADVGEVKVMCDLAMISAGETAVEIDKVSFFLSAVLGFSPLIFDLSENDGLEQLISACDKVWKSVEQDPTLVKKWVNKHTIFKILFIILTNAIKKRNIFQILEYLFFFS